MKKGASKGGSVFDQPTGSGDFKCTAWLTLNARLYQGRIKGEGLRSSNQDQDGRAGSTVLVFCSQRLIHNQYQNARQAEEDILGE
jgi:hypothetical protein